MLKKHKRILDLILIYQLLEENGKLTALEISEISGLPLRKVYRILSDFIEIGILGKCENYYFLFLQTFKNKKQ